MLQLDTAGCRALEKLRSGGDFPSPWRGMAELERAADEGVARFLEERWKVSLELGGGFLLNELIDRALRTSDVEHMDDRHLPEKERLALVRALDRQNGMMRLYPRYVDILRPLIEDIAARNSRKARLLELACGSGGLSFALAEEISKGVLPAEITGSDIVPAFIDAGNALAREKNLPVSFRVLDAFDMQLVDGEKFDLIVISQSLHHFTPGQLAVMIAHAATQASTAFVGIDGYRSTLLACGVPLIAALQGIPAFAQDGFTSARKFYSEMELDLIAGIATGRHEHAVTCSWPLSVVTIKFN
ncbi:MAG: class I SAM-dependent methyltransferase [Chlorobiaceae bacterium]